MSAQVLSIDSFQTVTFCLFDGQKKEDYAIPIEQVREIRAVESITNIPQAKSYVKGIMNLRGLIIPIIDVKERLGFASSEQANSSKQRILVIDVNGTQTGLLVDEVDQVMRIQTKDLDSAPQAILDSHSYIKGIAKINQKLIVLLDVVKLLQDSTDEISTAMEARQ
jgi:purine-binding chemotaxis protein CheW